MARIRTVKPELAAHEDLFDLEIDTSLPIRFAWVMLFTACDREGRFAWRPRTLKALILPHDNIDFSRVLDAWLTRGFIVKYRVGNEWFGWLPTFTKHQVINNRETESTLPSFDQAEESIDNRNQQHTNASGTRQSRDDDASGTREVRAQGEGKGREGKEGDIAQSDDKPIAPRSTDTPAKPNGKIVHELGPLNDGTSFPVTESQLHFWRQTYPAADIPAELLRMNAWLDSHPSQRKTQKGAKRFVTSWLDRVQNRPPPQGVKPAAQPWKGAL